MTYTKQPHCTASYDENKKNEKPEITENPDPQTILYDSLVRLYAELDDLSKEHPLRDEILLAITQETENAYEKLNTFLENFKKTGIYYSDIKGKAK